MFIWFGECGFVSVHPVIFGLWTYRCTHAKKFQVTAVIIPGKKEKIFAGL